MLTTLEQCFSNGVRQIARVSAKSLGFPREIVRVSARSLGFPREIVRFFAIDPEDPASDHCLSDK